LPLNYTDDWNFIPGNWRLCLIVFCFH